MTDNAARIIEEGLDTDTMKRYVVFAFDPPWLGQETKRLNFNGMTDDGLPTVMTDERIRSAYERHLRRIGYRLAE